MSGTDDRLINKTQGDSIITALQSIANNTQSPYNTTHKLNPKYINYNSNYAAVSASAVEALDATGKFYVDNEGYIGIEYGEKP